MNRCRRNERGVMLLAVAFMVVLLGGLAGALLIEVRSEQAMVTQHENNLYALEMAEAGLARAELEIFAMADVGDDGIGNVSGTLHEGDFEVTAQQDVANPDRWTLSAVGRRGMSVRRLEVGVRRREGNRGYQEGIFSKDEFLNNGGIVTDSYDSRNGSYGSQAINTDTHGIYARTNGHIGTNSNIIINGSSAAVRGNAIPGVLHNVQTSGDPLITGDTLPRTEQVDVPDPSYAEFFTALNANNNNDIGALGTNASGRVTEAAPSAVYDSTTKELNIASKYDVTLTDGTYFFSDVTVKGSLRIEGNVTIYMTGALTLGGQGIVNNTGNPANLGIVAHPYARPGLAAPSKLDDVKLTGGPEFIGTVYAPGRDVSLGGGTEVYGAVVGRTLTFHGDFVLHYDEALGAVGDGRGELVVERIYWRDISKPAR